MPTSATHITVAERVAATNAAMKALLGDPLADPATPTGTQMKFAKLGAVGPDIFYAMADYGGDLQTLENFLIKVAASFTAIGDLMGEVQRYIDGVESVITDGITDSIHQTFDLVTGALNEGVLALVVGPLGMNFWPIFEAARQQDKPREKWYWADYLHYIKSGDYAHALIDNARKTGNKNLLAYSYGYLTHYVTDVVGHPYVNQVVQGPWRVYWQRHHLVENFIDAYVWPRWHTSNPPPAPPSIDEQPLDTLVSSPNIVDPDAHPEIAPVTFARLNDHVNIGGSTLGDPVDGLVNAVADKIKKGLFDIGVAENIDPAVPSNADFTAWTQLVSKTIMQVYDQTAGHRTPQNLAQNIVPGIPPRPNGYPTADDVAGAYGVFRLVLRISTEEKISEPQPPDILGDISAAAQKLIDDLQNNLNSFPPVPNINTSGGFSWDSLWDAIKKIAEWLGETAAAIAKTVFDAIKDAIKLLGTAVADIIKYALYLLNKALFAIYNSFRDVLVYAGYAIPYTKGLAVDMGGGHNSEMLWKSPGNIVQYPVEEISKERKMSFTTYAPFIPPSEQPESQNPAGGLFFEHPNLSITAPYVPAGNGLLTPDVFLDPAAGPDDMFLSTGPQQKVTGNFTHVITPTITITPKNFGGAVANSIKGITLAEKGFPDGHMLPNYNLDGDRSYAWPCWDVTNPVPVNGITTTPLRPEATNDGTSVSEALASVVPVPA